MKNPDYYKKKLLDLKQELESQIDTLNKRGSDALKESVGELSSYDNHPSDLGNETFEREKDLGIRDNARIMLIKVNNALKKLEEGNYGICESCGKKIEEERLEIIPYTTLCADCNRKEEKDLSRRSRPVEEETLSFPFGRSFLDDTEYAAYDGEDAWQDVARYGTANTPQDEPGSRDYKDVYTDGNERRGITDRADKIIKNNDIDENEKNELGR